MGKPQSTGNLVNALAQDSSNNIGIGGAANASFKLQVTGATNLTGVLTLGSTISNGTFTYTLPSATGTLALTSALSGYLPLTGGTLTGALSGTSATFSGNMAIGVTPSPSDTFPALQVGRAGFMGAGNEVNISANGYYSSPSWKYIASDTAALYNIAGNVHSWYTAVSGTANGAISWAERMRITSGGNVGIGTSSPSIKLTVANAANGDIAAFTNSVDSDIYINLTSGVARLASGSGVLALGTGNTERMRISTGGNILINTTSDTGERFKVNGQVASYGSSALLQVQARDASTIYAWYADNNTNLYFFNTGNGITGQFTRTTGVYTALSDINKKKDFEDSKIGLNAIMGLKPTLFRMKEDNESIDKTLGFIAQQVKEFIPQAYVESGEGDDKFIGLQDRPIIAALVKAIQEQQAQIQELKAEIDELKNK